MGYNVRITHSTATIPASNEAEVLRIWKDLNKPENDMLKRGYGDGKRWFSWMPEDYDKTVTSVEEVLDHLGFDFEVLSDGIIITGYDNKIGQEELFMQRVAHLMTGKIYWVGEDDDEWTWVFHGGNSMSAIANDGNFLQIEG